MANTRANKNQYKIPGGTIGQALVKQSNADFDFDWGDVSGIGGGGGGNKIAIDTTQITLPNTTNVFTDLMTPAAIPGGTLGTNDAIRFSIALSNYSSGINVGDDLNIQLVYGGAVIGSFTITPPGSPVGVSGIIEGYIVADGATNAQKAFLQLKGTGNGWDYPAATVGITKSHGIDANTASAVDSTVEQDLQVQARWVASGSVACTITSEWSIVEGISNRGSGNAVEATAGNTFTGATLPQPVAFGDGNIDEFFDEAGGVPIFQEDMGTVAQEKLCFTVIVVPNNVVLVDRLSVWVDSVQGAPADDIRLSIQTTAAGDPTGVILGSGTISPPNVAALYSTNFASPIELTAGTYAVVIERVGAPDAVNYWRIGCNNSGGVNTAPFAYDGAVWNVDNLQPAIRIAHDYDADTAYLAAQSGGSPYRLESVIVSSGSGNTHKETVPAVLQTALGWVNVNASMGNTIAVVVSGAINGFSSLPLVPPGIYHVGSSDGTIAAGASGTIVGRSLTTDSMLQIPQ